MTEITDKENLDQSTDAVWQYQKPVSFDIETDRKANNSNSAVKKRLEKQTKRELTQKMIRAKLEEAGKRRAKLLADRLKKSFKWRHMREQSGSYELENIWLTWQRSYFVKENCDYVPAIYRRRNQCLPGPGSYEPQIVKFHREVSFSFARNSRHRSVHNDNAGPGQYEPNNPNFIKSFQHRGAKNRYYNRKAKAIMLKDIEHDIGFSFSIVFRN